MGRPINTHIDNVLAQNLEAKSLRLEIERTEELVELHTRQRDGLELVLDFVLGQQYEEAERAIAKLPIPVPQFLRAPAYVGPSNGDLQRIKANGKEVSV